MAQILAAALVAASCLAIGEGHSRPDNAGLGSSIQQIRDTLQNLLRSVEDKGSDAERLFGRREQWCGANVPSFEQFTAAAQTGHDQLKVDLEENKAAVQDAEGTAQQIRGDIMLISLTINQTEQMLSAWGDSSSKEAVHLMQGDSSASKEREFKRLLANKRRTLQSLEGQLEIVLVSVSQLQARVAETEHQATDSVDTIATGQALVESLRKGCASIQQHGEKLEAVHSNEAGSLKAALQALAQMSSMTPAAAQMGMTAATNSDTDSPSEVAFIQTKQDVVSEADLENLFGDLSSSGEAAFPVHKKQHQQPVRGALTQKRSNPRLQKKIQQLLAQINNKSPADADRKEFCKNEQSQNHLVEMLSAASASQMTAEISAHGDIEEHLTEDLQRSTSAAHAVEDALAQISEGAKKEQVLIARNTKDSGLAKKIAAQAIAILADIESSTLSSQMKQGAVNSASSLRSAMEAFSEEANYSIPVQHETEVLAKEIDDVGNAALKALTREMDNIALSRDWHVSQRKRGIAQKENFDARAQDAKAYLSKLASLCGQHGWLDQEEQERQAQVKVLHDAEEVLDGKQIARDQSAPALRGRPAVQPTKDMTPLERAAAAMGIYVD